MAEFHETRMGQKFYEADVPRIATALERIANAIEKLVKDKGLSDKLDKEEWRNE